MSEVFSGTNKSHKDPLIEYPFIKNTAAQWLPMYPKISVINTFSRIILFHFYFASKIIFNFYIKLLNLSIWQKI